MRGATASSSTRTRTGSLTATGVGAISARALGGLGLKFFLAILVVVIATLGGALGLIRLRASHAADAAISLGLEATQSSIEDALAARSQMLQQAGSILSHVPTYIAYVDQSLRAGDRSSLLAHATEMRDQAGADWVLITGPDGVLQASTRSPQAFGDSLGESALVGEALTGVSTQGIWIEGTPAGDSLFQAVAVPLSSGGSVSGTLVLALAIDSTLALRLKRHTASEVVFITFDTSGVPRVATSTLPAGTLDDALRDRYPAGASEPDSLPSRLTVEAGGLTWVAAAGPLTTSSGRIVGEYAGLRSRQAELAPFDALQRSILIAFLGALAIALVISLLLARQITSPLRRLVTATRAVAEGEYSGTVDIQSRDEIGEL